MHLGIKDRNHGGAVMKSPAEILTALAALWTRISSAIGRKQAEAAKAQQPEIDAMDAEIQGITKEPSNAT
jgi:hypothetical protein